MSHVMSLLQEFTQNMMNAEEESLGRRYRGRMPSALDVPGEREWQVGDGEKSVFMNLEHPVQSSIIPLSYLSVSTLGPHNVSQHRSKQWYKDIKSIILLQCLPTSLGIKARVFAMIFHFLLDWYLLYVPQTHQAHFHLRTFAPAVSSSWSAPPPSIYKAYSRTPIFLRSILIFDHSISFI